MDNTIIYILGINIASFLLMGYDKYSAIKNNWRISENSLIGISLLGGSIGTLLGMFTFHHKTKKKRFLIGIPICLIINILMLIVKE